MGPKFSDLTDNLVRREIEDTEGSRLCAEKGRDWTDAAASEEMPQIAGCHRRLASGHKGFFLRAFRRSVTPPTC